MKVTYAAFALPFVCVCFFFVCLCFFVCLFYFGPASGMEVPVPGTWPFDTANSFRSCPVFMLLCAGICYKQVNGGIAAGKKR